MDVFKTFIPTSKNLDIESVTSEGFISRIFPELPNGSELVQMALSVGAPVITLWGYEWRKKPEVREGVSLKEISQVFFDLSHNSLLLEFIGVNLFLWAPGDHDFFVVFGSSEVVKLSTTSDIFKYPFEEYVAERAISDNFRVALKEAQNQYEKGEGKGKDQIK